MAPPPQDSPELSGDEFINIWVGDEPTAAGSQKSFYGQWVDKASAKHSNPSVTGADALRRLYPNHSLVMTQGHGLDLLGFPAIQSVPLEKTPLITNVVYIPLARSLATIPGILVDQVQFGAFSVTWNQFEYIVFLISFPSGFGYTNQYFVLHEGPEEVSRLLLLAAGFWTNELHEEIWVFNQGSWQKNHSLWSEIQKADWNDVILKEEFKKALQNDVYGFFKSEAIYKQLSIPWKRGLIMYGPPGNGKTISIKTIMKTCSDKGFAPLHVKSFQSWMGEEGAMQEVFSKARQLSPCVVILEDLDSLINDRNRSFFLNQLDGLEGNDGLLIIGTTNHFDRLDPGLSARPSRFDRKYKFDDPDEYERRLYVRYWQKKLASNKEIEFPDSLVDEIARLTDRFSFAYLKEAFVSSLITFVSIEGEKPSFASVLKEQIESLRHQLDKSFKGAQTRDSESQHKNYLMPSQPPRQNSSNQRNIRVLLDALSGYAPPVDVSQGRKIYESPSPGGISETQTHNNRDIRALLAALSDSPGPRNITSVRSYGSNSIINPNPQEEAPDGRNFRALFDDISTEDTLGLLSHRLFEACQAPGTIPAGAMASSKDHSASG